MSDTSPTPPTPITPPAAAPSASQATLAITAGRTHGSGALAPTLYPTTTFRVGTVDESRSLATQVRPTHFYGRYGNPTVSEFEDVIAQLEGAEAARAFASGMAAISATVLALCSKGSHVVASRQLYGGTRQLLEQVCPRFGIDVTFVDGTEPGALAGAVIVGRTVLVLAETPANPRLDLVDLDELGAIEGPFTAVDSTFATPLGQNPIAHGVDLVIHSASKAIGGHNDAILGVVAGSADLIEWITGFSHLQGGCASPTDALNALRGIRTLPVRFAQQTATATAVAEFLACHPSVSEVRYPGLSTHPQFDLAKRQLRMAGGVLTFDVAGGRAGACSFVDRLKLALHAPSLGGPETLVCHPASTTHVGVDPDDLVVDGIGQGTIRLSCGLEATEDIVADLTQALA